MCGIVGAVAQRNILPILLEGLKRLEYRGYDSCGVALYQDGGLRRARSVARVADLAQAAEADALEGYTGIAHTRWATHGRPETCNAHPHFSPAEGAARIAVSHNGIIENHDLLRQELQTHGYHFASQTDSEVIAHLIDYLYQGDLFAAVQQAVARLSGSFAIAVICRDEPHRVVGARQGSPLVIGLGDGEHFLASDAMALAGITSRFVYLEDGDVADIQLQRHWICDGDGRPAERAPRTLSGHDNTVELGPYRHYMQKEIFEQPRAVADTLADVLAIMPELFGDGAYQALRQTGRVLILACGSSYYAGLTAKYWIESLARVPVEVEIASEYRYRDSIPHPDTLVVAISQSGETADTLAALRFAREQGMTRALAICNVATSALTRECPLHFLTRAGTEIGVASTKGFTTQLVALYLLALTLAQGRGRLDDAAELAQLKALRHLPKAMGAVLALEPQIIAWAERFAGKEHALFLGRGLHYPVALEGALKLKEISYIHAEAYPAGELKHGPLALVSEDMPVVAIAPNDKLLEKLKSNLHEVGARGGQLYVFCDRDSAIEPADNINAIHLTEHYGALSPILHTLAMQLLAYHTAVARGTDIDKPRNLAKSVTVE
ncbi:MAG: glutamine--fructose-6-phosphate transaminase (isomerizing) [Paludibacterium sp.]|uniref:glutamine--fructose-6-phosphate transaminase (isomerizing) n=1 Tax=Paludibacterium sp. TaxID=1917523 RepID=UPI0025F7C53F|nr:glutamine--fructose-6-phosphate transaminase (isomerizing) [Paludibacterium sp.]MBV8046186.1 glutamine--fructose-6-phosphate transaminase (isomerizing) [Paludibacterium sp.]MBV8649319.1 glutamine--fructose-6-phosphate transaminase (isomerizing) [Paludibacterium sp.]